MLRVAIAQFPISGDVDRNPAFMARQIQQAAAAKAQLVHFPEAAVTVTQAKTSPRLTASTGQP
jgi:predicted amidohydrolase